MTSCPLYTFNLSDTLYPRKIKKLFLLKNVFDSPQKWGNSLIWEKAPIPHKERQKKRRPPAQSRRLFIYPPGKRSPPERR